MVVNIRRGDISPASDIVPTEVQMESDAQYTESAISLSYQLLPIIPCSLGVVPVYTEACPGPVLVGA